MTSRRGRHHGRFPHPRPEPASDRRHQALVVLVGALLVIVCVLAGIGAVWLLVGGPLWTS